MQDTVRNFVEGLLGEKNWLKISEAQVCYVNLRENGFG